MSFELAKDYSDIGAIGGYWPEIDYRGNNYVPAGTPTCSLCTRCRDYYKLLYDSGITKEWCDEENIEKLDGTINPEPWFIPFCEGDLAERANHFAPEDFEDREEHLHAVTLLDPVAWAYAEFNWTARWYQEDMLRCSSQFQANRAGRRVGKTEKMAVGTLHKAWTQGNYEILVIAPYQPQVKKLFEMMRLFINLSVSLNGSVKTNRESPYEQISFNNGSTIRGFSSGARTGAKSDKIRGQDANLIIMDEVDYLADEDLEVISAILASNQNTGMVVASTPTGIRQKLHRWCTSKGERFKEFWFISRESPSWTKKAENYFKSNYSEGGFSREFLAEFGTEMVGVFRMGDIEAAIKKYKYTDTFYDPNRRYVIGVDWNKNTGTHIVVVEQRWDAERGAIYRLVEKEIIRRSEFTQITAVQKIMELDKKWQCSFIYVDAGYGHVQVEMLWKYDKDNPHRATNYRKRVVPVEMGGNTIIKNPITKEDEKKPTKPLFVNLLAAQLEQNRIEMPREEDTDTRILPEEIEVIEIGLVQQMREFKVTKYSPQGRPTYSQDFEHTLTAFMCAVGGFLLNFSDLAEKKFHHEATGFSGIGGGKKSAGDMKRSKANEALRRRRLSPQDRVGGMDHGKLRIESSPEPEKADRGYVLKNITQEPSLSPLLEVPSSEDVEAEMKLHNTGKASMKQIKGSRRPIWMRPGHGGGYRRGSF